MTPAIAYCIDAAYPMPLAVSLRSVLEKWNKDLPLEVFILHAKIPQRTHDKVMASLPENPKLKLSWIPVDLEKVEGLNAGGHYSSASYFPLLLPELLPKELGAVLYLDADTIARADISELFSLYDDKFAAQACEDYLGTIGNPLVKIAKPEDFGLRKNSPYFNTGVLLMNLKRWRKDGLGSKIIELGRRRPEALAFAARNIINLAISAQIGRLPHAWNAQTGHPKVLDGSQGVPFLPQDLAHAKIVHYTSEVKPWGSGRDMPQAAAFKEIVTRTEWK